MNRTARTTIPALALALASTAFGCGGGGLRQAGHSGAKGPAAPLAQPAFDSGGSFFEAEPASPAPPPRASAEAPEADSADAPAASSRRDVLLPQPEEHPGLGTEWGETRLSHITTVPFVRADFSRPFAVGTLHYNDAEGAGAMANAAGFQRSSSGLVRIAGGALVMGLRDESGRFLSGFVAGDRNYVIGEAGRRYTIVVRNRTSERLECVLSVDGLDVLDGRPASFSKRGYIVDPHGELEVDGFRQSHDTVAAFRFGSVRDSYASRKHGDTRNVGVIGIAVFHERGSNPFAWTDDEVQRRLDANPFPGRFATPPR